MFNFLSSFKKRIVFIFFLLVSNDFVFTYLLTFECYSLCISISSEENWEFFLKMHLQWRYDYLEEKFNPHDGKTYKYVSCCYTKWYPITDYHIIVLIVLFLEHLCRSVCYICIMYFLIIESLIHVLKSKFFIASATGGWS